MKGVSKKNDAFIFILAANLFIYMCTVNMRWLMIAKYSFIQISTIKIMVHLFDVLRLLMRYLGNFCQITVVMRLI